MDKFKRKIQTTKKQTPILNYHEKENVIETKRDSNIYYIPDSWHFGDYWIATNWFLRESERLKQTINVVNYDVIINISKELDSTGIINFISGPGNKEPQYNGYDVEYFKTKLRWRPTIKPHYRVCYQFDGKSYEDLKNPPKEDIEKLITFLPNYQFIGIGLPFNMHDSIRIAAQSDLFIGICSGMSHLVHSVGTPMFLIEYKLSLDRAHVKKKFTRCLGTNDCIEKVKSYIYEKHK